MTNTFEANTKVKVQQGFNKFTLGTVESYDGINKNRLGFVGNYKIKVTGGVNCFGKEVEIGKIITVNSSNVLAD